MAGTGCRAILANFQASPPTIFRRAMRKARTGSRVRRRTASAGSERQRRPEPARRLKLSEGQVVRVPLEGEGYAWGVVARVPRRQGVILGHFFVDRDSSARDPSIKEREVFNPDDADLVCICGGLYIREGRWPVVGRVANWDRERWPVREFRRTSKLGLPDLIVTYRDDDLFNEVSTRRATASDVHRWKDALSGPGLVEEELADLLREHRVRTSSSSGRNGADPAT